MSQLRDYVDLSDADTLDEEFISKGSEEVEKLNKDIFLNQPKLNFNPNLYVILIGIPKIKEDLKPKLITALKGYLKKNNYAQFTDIELNISGQAVLTYENEESAQVAAAQLNNSNFDAKHQLQAFTYKQIEHINSTTEFVPLALKSKKELREFLQSPFPSITVIQEKTKLAQKSLNPLEKKLDDEVKEKKLPNFEKLFWSPNGQYLVLIDEFSFSLYGGKDLEFLHKFDHFKVADLLFSPQEDFVISYDNQQKFIIWDIRDELMMRQFKLTQTSLSNFKFHRDGTLLALQGQDDVQIYDTTKQFSQKSELYLKTPGVKQIEWIPQTNYLAIVCYGKDVKTQIFLHDYKRNIDVKWRNIAFDIESISLYPHTYGKWIAVLIKKKQKNKVFATTLQVGNLNRTDPFEIDEHTVSEDVDSFFAELNTGKFGLCYREKDKQQKPTSQFTFHLYAVSEETKSGIKLQQLGEQKGKETNEILWASNGNYFAMVNKTKNSPDQGKVEFGQIQKKNDQLKIEITKSTNHFYMSHASWDPTGINLLTMSDLWHSVNIWSAIGEQLVKDTITKVTDVQWRNRPVHILSAKEEQELLANSKNFTKNYELEDDKVLNKAKYEKEQKRKQMKDQFTNYLSEKKKIYQSTKDQRVKLLGWDDEDPKNYVPYQKLVMEEIVN